MANLAMMREYVASQYSGEWRGKVNKMEDHQVIAIYHSMVNRKKRNRKTEEPERVHQISMFDDPYFHL